MGDAKPVVGSSGGRAAGRLNVSGRRASTLKDAARRSRRIPASRQAGSLTSTRGRCTRGTTAPGRGRRRWADSRATPDATARSTREDGEPRGRCRRDRLPRGCRRRGPAGAVGPRAAAAAVGPAGRAAARRRDGDRPPGARSRHARRRADPRRRRARVRVPAGRLRGRPAAVRPGRGPAGDRCVVRLAHPRPRRGGPAGSRRVGPRVRAGGTRADDDRTRDAAARAAGEGSAARPPRALPAGRGCGRRALSDPGHRGVPRHAEQVRRTDLARRRRRPCDGTEGGPAWGAVGRQAGDGHRGRPARDRPDHPAWDGAAVDSADRRDRSLPPRRGARRLPRRHRAPAFGQVGLRRSWNRNSTPSDTGSSSRSSSCTRG